MLILNIIQGPEKGRRFELPDNEPQLIGRSSEALPLTDTTISRRHAELTPDDGKWYIRDIDSSNGTYVNGRRISKRTLLRGGDQIRAGSTLFVFGRTAEKRLNRTLNIFASDHLEASVEASTPSNEDSLIMAVPEPSQAAQFHLKVLYDLMQLVGTIFDRSVLLERVLDLIFDHFEPDRGFIMLREDGMDDEPKPVVIRYRYEPRNAEEQRITVSRTIVNHVISHSEGVLSSNAMTDKRFAAGESIQAMGIRSAICVPIKYHDKIYGVIYIDSKVMNYTFTEDQLRLMTAIGAQTGLALENAELYRSGLANARLAAMGETVASLSHSIRNMMQAIRGGSEVVELGLRKNDISLVGNGWDILARNLDRVFQLTMNMLAFSKQRKPEFELISLPKLLQEIVELIQPQCDRRQVALIAEFDEEMPPLPADPGGIHQAVMNLMTNALEAVEPESGVIILRCSYDDQHHQATVSVTDNGQGIDPESYKQLYKPFYSTKGLRGTGLGLAVTQKIVSEHGGEIQIESELGAGSTFTLSFSAESTADPAATH